MFWSLILEPGKRYSSTVDKTFHLSMAALDVTHARNVNSMHDVCPVQLEIDDQKLILCNLCAQQHVYQVGLDLLFRRGTKLTFYTTGKVKIHLTGYLIIEDDMSDVEDFSDESEDESMEAEDNLMKKSKQKTSKINQKGDAKFQLKPNVSKQDSPTKRKLEAIDVSSKKKAKPAEMESSGDDDDESGDSYLDALNMSDSDGEENDDIEGEESEDGEDEEDDSLGEFSGSDEDDDDDESTESDDAIPPRPTPKKKQNDVKTPSQDKKAQVKTPISSQKDGKQGKQSQPVANGTTPKSENKNKNKNTPQQQQPQKQGKTPNKGNESSNTPQKRVVEGGVIVEELKTGNGPVAKPGKLLSMYYVGRLKNNNRVFDQSQSGPGFKFRLGRQEVIKGWDVGISGMKVGSKRRITCPPAMAYGSKGSAPEIPPNSTLVFDVELKSVN